MNHYNMDAATTMFFDRELEQIKARTFEVLRAPLMSTILIPVDSTSSPGATTVTYTMYDTTGSAKIISNYADDLPTSDAFGIQRTSNLRGIGNSFIITLEDIRAAQYANKPIEARKARSAARDQLQLMNRLAFFGDAKVGIKGWLTNTDVNSALVSGANAGARVWSAKAPAAILADLNEAVSYIIDTTNGMEMPDTIVMPVKQYQLISNTQFAAGTDTTILEFFLGNNPRIKVEMANELKGAFGALDGFIAYKKDADKFYQEIPQAFEMFPAQWTNLAYTIPCHSKHGGTIIVYPKSQAFRTGI